MEIGPKPQSVKQGVDRMEENDRQPFGRKAKQMKKVKIKSD